MQADKGCDQFSSLSITRALQTIICCLV